jgi:hypothetical protein
MGFKMFRRKPVPRQTALAEKVRKVFSESGIKREDSQQMFLSRTASPVRGSTNAVAVSVGEYSHEKILFSFSFSDLYLVW